MLVTVLLLLASTPLFAEAQECVIPEEPMKAMLDSMEDMFLPGATFNEQFYNAIRTALTYFDPELPASQDGGWKGIIEYWDSDGVVDDRWGDTPANLSECTPTNISICNMTIYEPCDYTSNVAFYHTITEIYQRVMDENWPLSMPSEYIKALIQSFAMVGVASSFWHGANTKLSGQQDFISNDLFAYVQHQASLASLPYNPVLHDLSLVPRNMTAIELAQAFTDMYRNESVYDWQALTAELDVPTIELAYSGLFCTIMTMVFEDEFVDSIIEDLANLFEVRPGELNFTTEYYLPQLRDAIEGFEWTEIEMVKFIGNSVGTVIKLVYAMLWQEKIFDISSAIFTLPPVNQKGWEILPDLNVRAGQFMTYPYYEKKFQVAQDIYPGEDECNPVWAHTKWHLEASIGILDLSYVVDDIYRHFSTIN